MKKNIISLFAVLFISISTAAINLNAQVRPYTATDVQMQNLLNRIETRTDAFRRSITNALDSSSMNGTEAEDAIVRYIADFENSTDMLSQRFGTRRSVDADVENVLNRAAFINQFMQNNRLTTTAQNNWNYLRADLNTLANFYGVTWSWTNPVVVPNTSTDTRSYNVTDNQVQTLLRSIETNTDVFRRSAERSINRQNTTDNNISQLITDFENETNRLQQRFDARQSVGGDVQTVLTRAYQIDQFVRNNRLNAASQRNWNTLRANLDTLASYYDVTWNWTNPPLNNNNNNPTYGSNTPYNVSETNVRNLIARLDRNTDDYRRQLNLDIDRSTLNNTRSEAALNAYIDDFEASVDRLRVNFDARRSTQSDVDEVLSRAYNIDTFMRDYRLSQVTEVRWRTVRSDLDTLSNYYSVAWNWNNPTNNQASRLDQMLSGTYRLNLTQSDNVSEVVQRATATGTVANRDRMRTNLERRLTSPDMLAIEKVGSQVTIASSTAPQISFTADNTARTETNPNGRQVKITASSTYNGVSLNYEGERMNDFYVNFIPMSNGQLRVVRRVYLENRNETVTVASVYDKVSTTAQWSQVNNGSIDNNTGVGSLNNTFVIPNNTRLTATLTTPVSTKTSQNGDRFQMEITSPGQYQGAIIEGRVASTQRSGRVSGRANVSLEFDTIRLRNGQTYRFAGIVDAVTRSNGDTVAVNNEGTVRDNNQTSKTVTRAGIGAAIGAIIGAIAGGGQGAAVGAGIGAGAGAGSVILQGRDDVELENGTQFSITATAPASVSGNFR